MTAAIASLQATLAVLQTNEPINRQEGHLEQADAEAQSITEIEEALKWISLFLEDKDKEAQKPSELEELFKQNAHEFLPLHGEGDKKAELYSAISITTDHICLWDVGLGARFEAIVDVARSNLAEKVQQARSCLGPFVNERVEWVCERNSNNPLGCLGFWRFTANATTPVKEEALKVLTVLNPLPTEEVAA